MLVIFIRTLILYSLVIVVMRLMGKRQVGELQPFELAAAIMISELASVPMQNTGIPLLSGIIPIITLLIAQIVLSLICLKSNKARTLVYGKPAVLVENGKIIEDNLQREMYTLNDLLEQLRINNVPNIADVEFAILETTGQLSIVPKSQKRPLNPKDMKISTKYEGLPLNIIVDGEIIFENLQKANLDKQWLEQQLQNFKIHKPNNVLLASIDTDGNLYVQAKKRSRN